MLVARVTIGPIESGCYLKGVQPVTPYPDSIGSAPCARDRDTIEEQADWASAHHMQRD